MLTTDELRQIVETDHTQCEDAAAMARELLANREAQPVGKPFGYYSEETTALLGRRGFAPISADPLVDHNKPLYTAPPAPAVPDEMGGITPYCHGWNECRAAMLDQPVSQGYKLNSPEIPDGWKLVPIDATRAMIDAAQMVEEDGYDAMHKAMLAAAPEGGNG